MQDKLNMGDINGARSIVIELVRKIRIRLLLMASFNILLLSFIIFSLSQILTIELTYAIPANIFFFVLVLYFFINSKKYKSMTIENLLEHINRTRSSYEEASQVILSNKDTALSNLVRSKVASQIINDQNTFRSLLPEFTWVKSLSLFFLLSVMNILSSELSRLIALSATKFSAVKSSIARPSQESLQKKSMIKPDKPLSIKSADVKIEPPAYTQQSSISTQQLDLNLLENSTVSWQLTFNKPVKSAFLVFSDRILNTVKENNKITPSSIRIEMEYDIESGKFYSTYQIKTTQIYRIETIEILPNDKIDNKLDTSQAIEQVFSIIVSPDRTPKIKIISPKFNLTEISKSMGAVKDIQHLLTAVVKDDFGISKVEILASVAKGSGEAVKFRDKVLPFDHQEVISIQGRHSSRHTKKWSFADLGMEPGDEVYLSIYATDNREPKHNTNKSSSLIFRWLDEEDTGLSAEGLTIIHVPEYFKSQRQIIIDTKALIQDRADIETDNFEQRSIDLGQSQSDLKRKYGQFSSDHNTGSINIGALSTRNPKTWMQMAIAEMWQAELNLQLSDPKKALPFEEKAYKYLKLARKADRIYAKRLGFEPPPVTEKNRLTGDLNELKSNQLNKISFQDPRSNQMVNRQVFQIINQWQLKGQQIEPALDKDSLALITQLKSNLFVMAKARPTLIKYAAISERILLAKTLKLINCDLCIEQLKMRLWLMMDPPNSLPNLFERSSLLDLETEINYLMKIRDTILPPIQSKNNKDNHENNRKDKQGENEHLKGFGS